MAVSLDTIRDLFDNKQWAACADNAAMALAQGDNDKAGKAQLNFYRSVSLRRLKQFGEALEPGRLALYLSEELTDTELTGRALLNLAWVLHKIPGMEHAAVETQRRFLDQFPRFTSLRDEYLSAMLNLGVYLRAAGHFGEAYAHFRATAEVAKQRGDAETAELCRSYAVWEALRLRRIEEAESLIREGEQRKQTTPRVRAAHLLDLAELSMVKNDPRSAAGYVIAAAPLIEQARDEDPHLLPNALEILQRVSVALDEPELSLVVGVLAKETAELDDRQDFVALAVDTLDHVALLHPLAVEKSMRFLDSDRNDKEAGKP